ncbi:MAG TPA: hypothetical protein VL527_14450 [Dongiaceae bacterium]|jgi:hypothetical protein|nr:hypothetical protein [Dongiaceae bacterium]
MNTTKHPGIIGTAKADGIAVVAGTGKVIEATVNTAEKVVATTVKDVAKVGVGVEHAAVAVGGGVIKGTEKLAVGTEHAVGEIAGGAVKAVGNASATVVDAARHTVHGNPGETKKPETAKA